MSETKATQRGYSFRTLNYLGSKLRLLDFIEEHIRCVTPKGAGVCDLFAGSGCVSYRLSSMFPVTACDIQQYSVTICNALLKKFDISYSTIESCWELIDSHDANKLESVFSPLIEKEETAIKEKDLAILADIVDHGSIEAYREDGIVSLVSEQQNRVLNAIRSSGLAQRDTFISRHYGGVYFSYRQAVRIDAILMAIRNSVVPSLRDVFLAALMSAVSDVVDTVGKHFAQPLKTHDRKGKIKSLVYNKAVRDKTIDVVKAFKGWFDEYIALPKGDFPNRIIKGNYIDCLGVLSNNVATVYADPPYTREHYSRFYHVLETIALGDLPGISRVTIHGLTHLSNGLYRNDRYQSPFCIKSKAPDAFDCLFRTISAKGCNLLLSYSPYDETKKTHPRVVTMAQLISWCKQYFRGVDVVSAGYFTHNKLNSAEHVLESSKEAEMLIVCTGGR